MQDDINAPLADDLIIARLEVMAGDWTLTNGAISRTFVTTGWKASLMLVNAIGFICETAWHHPEITLSWGRVDVRLWTHSAGGVTARDLAMAHEIEALVSWKPVDSPLEGIPQRSGHAILQQG